MSGEIEKDPFESLPDPLIEELIIKKTHAAILGAMLAGAFFIPVLHLFVLPFSILRIVQAKKLCEKYPQLAKPYSLFPGMKKKDVKMEALEFKKLKAVLDFDQARKVFVVTAIFPTVFIGGMIALICF